MEKLDARTFLKERGYRLSLLPEDIDKVLDLYANLKNREASKTIIKKEKTKNQDLIEVQGCRDCVFSRLVDNNFECANFKTKTKNCELTNSLKTSEKPKWCPLLKKNVLIKLDY